MRFWLRTAFLTTFLPLIFCNGATAMFVTPSCYSQQKVEDLRESAESGNAGSQFELGWFYAYVSHYCANIKSLTESNQIEAEKWMRKAAEQGEMKAQVWEGLFNQSGMGVAQSYEEAAKWYSKAAQQGEPTGQDLLGRLYRDGHGVVQNYNKAAELFRKSAEQKYINGSADLSRLYAKGGPNFPKNYEEAYFWELLPNRWSNGVLRVANPILSPYFDTPQDPESWHEVTSHLSPEQIDVQNKRISKWSFMLTAPEKE